ncbi:hypothetical protein [Streptomyces fulvoviolaceus]|uniref:hypothetical protein n=1 Tax=Streptomyces fulvoviolaceus TaxID=285535 RepID=UPI0021C0D00D|nr:hypothetical protein [Streptomyces fulvoviolaceus]MCT9080225.1 hypothetical protein [Streptomyces fulvoviolaceus]
MHRTTTTATLLVTVAVSALTGCVTVQRPPASGPPAAPSEPSAPRPDGRSEPQIVQAPAREALEMIGPSGRPEPAATTPRHATPSAPAQQQRQQQPPRSHPEHPAHPARPEPRQPHVEVPDVTKSVPKVPKNAQDVCALGKKYGRWQADSPESVICQQTYGR